DAADNLSTTIKAYTIKSRVTAECDRRTVASGRAYPNPANSWLENAEAADVVKPFHAIIAMAKPQNNSRVFCADDIDKSTAPYLVYSQIDVPRKAADIAVALSFELRKSRTLTLVDPYFRPGEHAFCAVVKALIAEASIERPLASIEIHCLVRN